MTRLTLVFVVSLTSAQAAVIAANSAQGSDLFESLHCIQCHSLNGQGGKLGPDLGQLIDRNFTPASLAATMWNHAPTMWAAMRAQNVRAGDLNPHAAADLFAYFYSRRFFSKPGDAARGKQAFESKHCAECHGLTQTKLAGAKPVSQWEALDHPVALVSAMWNHAATMQQEFAKQRITWPELDAQNLTDILVYLRNLPETRNLTSGFDINSGNSGPALFQAKGCAACHTGALALEPRLKGKTLTEIAVAMWNHEPTMGKPAPSLDTDEMRSLLSFLWAQEFFEDSGNASAGQKVFAARHCAVCHSNPASGAPKLPASGMAFDGATMVSALWAHGPRMLQQMQSQGIRWPRFQANEMSNLIAYLNSAK